MIESYRNDCKSRKFHETHVLTYEGFIRKIVPNKQDLYDVYVETAGLVEVVYIAVFEENGKVQNADKYLYKHK